MQTLSLQGDPSVSGRSGSRSSRPQTPASCGVKQFQFDEDEHEEKVLVRPRTSMLGPLHLQLPFMTPSHSRSRTPNHSENEKRSPRLPRRAIPSEGSMFAVKTIVFIRHGKSVWNLEKDKGRLSAIRAGVSGAMELHHVRNQSKKHSSTNILDAPLSSVGIEEAHALSQFLCRQSTVQRKRRLSTLRSHQSLANPLKDAIRHLNSALTDESETPSSPGGADHFIIIDEAEHSPTPSDFTREPSSSATGLWIDDAKLTDSWNDLERNRLYSITETNDDTNIFLPLRTLTTDSYAVTGRRGTVDQDLPDISDHPDYKRLRQAAESSLASLTEALERLESHMYKAQFSSVPASPSTPTYRRRTAISPIVSNNPCRRRSLSGSLSDLNLPIETDWIIDELYMGKSDTSVVVSSNLRRAISTAVIGLWNRFAVNYFEKVVVLPELQEIGKGIDTLSPSICYDVSESERESGLVNVGKLAHFYTNRLNYMHAATKHRVESGSDARQRLRQFAAWVFQQNAPMVVAVGHSTWMREFFREYLPTESEHIAKRSKVSHSSAIAFRFSRRLTSKGEEYTIYEGSIAPLYRGFV